MQYAARDKYGRKIERMRFRAMNYLPTTADLSRRFRAALYEVVGLMKPALRPVRVARSEPLRGRGVARKQRGMSFALK